MNNTGNKHQENKKCKKSSLELEGSVIGCSCTWKHVFNMRLLQCVSTFPIISCNTQVILHSNASYLHGITVMLMFCKLFHTSIKQGNGYYINISNNKSVGFHVSKAFRGRAVLLGHWATALEIEKQKEDTCFYIYSFWMIQKWRATICWFPQKHFESFQHPARLF